MIRTLKNFRTYRDWRMAGIAGVLGFAVTLAGMKIFDAYSAGLTALSITLATVVGSLIGICVAGSASALSVRQKLTEHNLQLDVALNNMIQGLCMFDAQNRLHLERLRHQ